MIFGRGISFAQQSYCLQSVCVNFKYVKKSPILFLPFIPCDVTVPIIQCHAYFAYFINLFESET